MGPPRTDLFQKCRNYTRHKEAEANGLYPYFKAIESGADAEVMIKGKKMIMIGSNNYLGLTTHPKVKEAAAAAIQKYGSGCTGSRFLNGTLDIHEELEHRLAKFIRKERALLFSTGFQTNLGTISTLVGKDDVILCDRMNHASIIDGCRLAKARTVIYRHNDLAHLRELLESTPGRRLVVTESIFSMDGDAAAVSELAALCAEHSALLIVDEAHAAGIFGPGGAGVAADEGLTAEIDVHMGTLGKALGSFGAYVAGSRTLVETLVNRARSFIFTTGLPPAAVAAARAAIGIVRSEPQLGRTLRERAHRLGLGLRDAGLDVPHLDSQILPVVLGDARRAVAVANALLERGVYVAAIRPPTVPPGTSRLRLSHMATHTQEDVEKAGRAIRESIAS